MVLPSGFARGSAAFAGHHILSRMSLDAIGLDIGGANIKVATATGRAHARPFELWRHPDQLVNELAELRHLFAEIETVAITMTGELCDCYPTKRDGVPHILAAVERAFGPAVQVWSTGGFVTLGEATEAALAVAAANWHALATFVGRFVPTGPALLIDTGSTTTDIIPLWDGRPAAFGMTDPERLKSRELVYTGVRRTPVCAVMGDSVAAEWFATTHDVYVRLGVLPEDPEWCATADGRPMTMANAHARLARMLGGDSEVTSEAETFHLAADVFNRQRGTIASAVARVVKKSINSPGVVVLSGSGEFLARAGWEVWEGAPDACRAISLSECLGPARSEAACAYAVAVLAAEAKQ